jgi:hypothetical protein
MEIAWDFSDLLLWGAWFVSGWGAAKLHSHWRA